MSESNLKIMNVMKENIKLFKQSDASIIEESHSNTEEENRCEFFNEA
jgi:hypothetical protein